MGVVLPYVTWVEYVAFLCRWRASLGCVNSALTWVKSYVIAIIEILSWRKKYWMSTFETKMKKYSKKIWTVTLEKSWFKEQVSVNNIWTGNEIILNMPESAETYLNMDTSNSKFSSRQIFSLRFSKWDTYYSLWEKKTETTLNVSYFEKIMSHWEYI